MTKFRTPKPANDHLAAFGKKDDLDRLTDAELEARVEATNEATGAALMRALNLRILRNREQTLAWLETGAGKNRS